MKITIENNDNSITFETSFNIAQLFANMESRNTHYSKVNIETELTNEIYALLEKRIKQMIYVHVVHRTKTGIKLQLDVHNDSKNVALKPL